MIVLTRLLVDITPDADASSVISSLTDRLEHLGGVRSVTSHAVASASSQTLEFTVECDDDPQRDMFVEFLRERSDAYRNLTPDLLGHLYIEDAARDGLDPKLLLDVQAVGA